MLPSKFAKRTQRECYGCVRDCERNGDRMSECLSGMWVVEIS